ncbi:hypothetical protein [Maribacter sp. 2308TA10-17]|uniref:hypothetical protein n=1 Tax=Maribacter sp. 2308TA10-17 TaxID=3386276 RepID=UPI0039BC76E8
MKKSSFLKTVLPFLPLLIFYVVVVTVFSSSELIGDEPRHMSYATNLANGYYAEPDNPSLRNGPGYPLVILLPVILNASYDFIRLLNVPFMLFAVVFFYRALRFYLKPNKAIMLSYVFALYPPILKCMTSIYSEAFTLFLICGFLYYLIKLNRAQIKSISLIIISASFLGVLVLTKVIFGYVILAAILFYLLLFLVKRSTQKRNLLFVLIGGFLFSVPYLLYTYSVTEKAFLWGTQGGEILYWRSTPFENEYGNWVSIEDVLGENNSEQYSTTELFNNHGDFIQSLVPLSYLERDALFKEKAIENIKQYPLKYIKNTGASAFRLFFNSPYSYTPQKMSSYLYIIPNMFLLTFLVFSIYLGIKNRKLASFEIRFLGLMALIFIGGLTLLDGRVRHLIPIIPVLLFIIAVAFSQFVRLNIEVSKFAINDEIPRED